MHVTADEARRIAGLAHLELSDERLTGLAVEMTRILDYIDQLRLAPGVEAEKDSAPASELFRDDTPFPSTPRQLVAGNAPEWRDGFFVVPRVLGE